MAATWRRSSAAALRAHATAVPRSGIAARARMPARVPVLVLRPFSVSATAEVSGSLDVKTSADGSRYLVTLGDTMYSVDPESTVSNFAKQIKDENDAANVRVLASADSGVRMASGARMADALAMGCVVDHGGKLFSAAAAAPLSVASNAVVTAMGGGSAWNPSREELDSLKEKFIPLFKEKRQLDLAADKRASQLLWGAMAYYSVQTMFLARLTWWEFNWDIMEPVTYFITVGTSVLGFAYFNIQKSEYTYDHLRGVLISKRMFKNYVKNNFAIDEYFALEDKIHKANPELLAEIEYDLEQDEYEAKSGLKNA